MDSITILIISASTFLTSLISGTFGMAGGMILKTVLLNVLSVSASMIIHSIIQMTSNSWRCFIWRSHIAWRVLPPYVAGIAIGLLLISSVHFVPNTATVLIVLGLVPLISLILRKICLISIESKKQTFVTAIFLTMMQMTTGAIGPLLDLLYIRSSLTRHQIVSTKAFTQTIMHLIRLTYYALIIPYILKIGNGDPWPEGLSIGTILLFVICAVLGTSVAAPIVNRLSDHHFRRYSTIIIALISCYCLSQGLYMALKS